LFIMRRMDRRASYLFFAVERRARTRVAASRVRPLYAVAPAAAMHVSGIAGGVPS